MSSEPFSLTDNIQTDEDKHLQAELFDAGSIPRHIAIIMDGNGRWAQKKGNIRLYGHKAGVESVRDVTEACAQLGVDYLTLYAFSTENWNRPENEVNALMSLFVETIEKEIPTLNKNNIYKQFKVNNNDYIIYYNIKKEKL
jgi:undecaprenyl diphosphate synthase